MQEAVTTIVGADAFLTTYQQQVIHRCRGQFCNTSCVALTFMTLLPSVSFQHWVSTLCHVSWLRTQVTAFSDAAGNLPATPPGTTATTVTALGDSLTALLPLSDKSAECRQIAGNLTVLQDAQSSPLLDNTIANVTT